MVDFSIRKSGNNTSHAHFDFATLHLSGRLSPYKSAIINAPTSKLVERYYHTFTRLAS